LTRPRISASLRDEIRNRAEGRCEYCRKPEIASLYAHQVDHILPLKHDGVSTEANLARTCFRCNVNKGSDISGYDPISGGLTPLFDARNLRWEGHFES
jgi:5-methylcytosine-specific restriction endonuclease McrA